MKNSIGQKLPHIKGQQITQLANKAKCDWTYVYKLLRGERNANSSRARAIISAAKKLNNILENADKKLDKEFLLISDED